ncbi:hypothetical protein [Helicobacter sp. MIT 05-5294]|uniref:hypothetical protein n=1 Tax=Helicobacter sp. MIT 05-5294 TaxID=1548150 RepID=UPI00051F97EB|nr:hypothetical protein [Helicobacter sp. MIT 05-5294]TLD86549.1 hypothetical protein LS69_005990 [Helicobacter sp. MIT 05-5294]
MKFLTNLFKSKRKKFEELLKQTQIIRIRTLEEGCDDEIVIIPPVDEDLIDSLHSLLQKGVEVRLEDISLIEDSIQDCKQDICDNPNTYDCPQEILADENTLQDWINQTIATYPRIFILNKILNLLKQYLRTS